MQIWSQIWEIRAFFCQNYQFFQIIGPHFEFGKSEVEYVIGDPKNIQLTASDATA